MWIPLEALAVDDRGSGLVVLLLTDPHLLEGGEGGQDGAADPHRIFPLWGGDDLQDISHKVLLFFCYYYFITPNKCDRQLKLLICVT